MVNTLVSNNLPTCLVLGNPCDSLSPKIYQQSFELGQYLETQHYNVAILAFGRGAIKHLKEGFDQVRQQDSTAVKPEIIGLGPRGIFVEKNLCAHDFSHNKQSDDFICVTKNIDEAQEIAFDHAEHIIALPGTDFHTLVDVQKAYEHLRSKKSPTQTLWLFGSEYTSISQQAWRNKNTEQDVYSHIKMVGNVTEFMRHPASKMPGLKMCA